MQVYKKKWMTGFFDFVFIFFYPAKDRLIATMSVFKFAAGNTVLTVGPEHAKQLTVISFAVNQDKSLLGNMIVQLPQPQAFGSSSFLLQVNGQMNTNLEFRAPAGINVAWVNKKASSLSNTLVLPACPGDAIIQVSVAGQQWRVDLHGQELPGGCLIQHSDDIHNTTLTQNDTYCLVSLALILTKATSITIGRSGADFREIPLVVAGNAAGNNLTLTCANGIKVDVAGTNGTATGSYNTTVTFAGIGINSILRVKWLAGSSAGIHITGCLNAVSSAVTGS